MVVVVFGMHRGGTSLAASVLEALGVNMGQRFSPPNAINPYGYFEDLDFHELNRKALSAAGGCWYDPPDGYRIFRVMLDHEDEIRGLFERKSRQADKWGWKDPRTVLTWPFYEYCLHSMPAHQQVLAVRMVRDRKAICHSLNKWYSHLHVDWAALVGYYGSWISTHEAMIGTQFVYRMRFEDLVTESRAERVVAGLAGFLGVSLDKVGPALDRIHFRRP